MGDGTSSGVQTPEQPGVIVKDRENFPVIPERLLKLSCEQLQERIDKLNHALEINRESILPNPKTEERLENSLAIHEFAKVAVERNRRLRERL